MARLQPCSLLNITPPLRGSRQDQGVARRRAGGGQTPRPVSEYIRHGQWRAYDKKCDDGLRQKQSTTRRFWSNRAFRNCRGALETVCEVLSGPHRSLTPRLPPPSAVWRLGFHPPPHQPSPAGSASATPPHGGSDWSTALMPSWLWVASSSGTGSMTSGSGAPCRGSDSNFFCRTPAGPRDGIAGFRHPV